MRILYEILELLVLIIARYYWISGEFRQYAVKAILCTVAKYQNLYVREYPVKIEWFYDPKSKIESAWNFSPIKMIQSIGI